MVTFLLADAFHASLHLGCDVSPHLQDAMSLHVGTHEMRPQPSNCPAFFIEPQRHRDYEFLSADK